MPNPIIAPACYTPVFAVTYADGDSGTQVVSSSRPLPVAPIVVDKPLAMSGNVTESGQLGPLTVLPRLPVMLMLAGTWTGTVTLLRSFDGGATRGRLTALGQAYGQFSTNICEPVWEEAEDGVTLYLDIALQSGSLTYRMGQ
jgi:hypothetical protein